MSSEPECPVGVATPPSTRGPVSCLSSWWRAALLSLACLALLAGLAALAAATAVYTINTPCSPGRLQCGNTGQCVRDGTWTSMLSVGSACGWTYNTVAQATMFMSVLSGKTSSVTALLTAGMTAMKHSVQNSAVPALNTSVGTPRSVWRSLAMETANTGRKSSARPGPVLRTEHTNVTMDSVLQIQIFAMVKRTAQTARMKWKISVRIVQ